MKKISVLFLALFLSATAQAHQLDKVTGLAMPESALAGKDGRVYVSEIGVFGDDRRRFICGGQTTQHQD